jgi:hypothetical protein
MLNKPFKVLIGTDVSWNGSCVTGATVVTVASAAAAGEVIVFDKNKCILAPGATIADSDTIFIGQVTSDTYDYTPESGAAVTAAKRIIFSDPIEGRNVTSYSGKAYTALSEQVTTFTFTNLVVTAGIELVLRLVYRDLQEQKGGGQFVHSYHYTTVAGETVDSAAIAIAALVNAHKGARVVATLNAGSDYFILTGKAIPSCTTGLDDIDSYVQVEFDSYLNYIDTNGYQVETLATQSTTAAVKGNGTWELVRDFENAGRGYRGFTNQTAFPFNIHPLRCTVKSETYDTINIEHRKNYLSSDNSYHKTASLKTIIFIPDNTSANQMDTILGILNPWMASCPGAFGFVKL